MTKLLMQTTEDIFWTGEYYPSHVDIDLEKNYFLDKIEISTPKIGTTEFTVYTSMDGRDFTEVQSLDAINGKESRIIRVYVEYCSECEVPVICSVRVFGKESQTAVKKKPKIDIEAYHTSKYNVPISKEDTYNEVYGIIQRRLGDEYKAWFTLELSDNPIQGHTYDYFELSSDTHTIHIKGNNGVSLASGLHYYLKYYCKVNISQVGDHVNMPSQVIFLDKPVFQETKAKVRYAYNYCTFSYSMPFWGAKEWRQELDWLALNGVNVVLDITAQEEVWRRFLIDLGYTYSDILNFISGPAYYAWAYMANLSGFGGPVHDSWFEDRTELARKNQLIMRKLGMQPVLQGYSGMIPNNISKYDSGAEIIEQGLWGSFKRPDMLKTTSPTFRKYAEKFYHAQEEVYGKWTHYYATDPFHEGGNTGGVSSKDVAEGVLNAMLDFDPNAVWVIQSWEGNPTSELLAGVESVENGKEHALILDLYADKTPHYNEGNETNASYGYKDEFNHTPWVFCMLNNFGGRLGLHGHLDNLAKGIPVAFQNCKHIQGIGITPEASQNNPVLYDFFFETIWQNNADEALQELDLTQWLEHYIERRYGVYSQHAKEAWSILTDTVYKSTFNELGQGAPESVVNARPSLEIQAASTWGNSIVSYDKKELEKAAILLLEDYELFKNSDGYRYDLVSILQQVLSNRAGDCHKKMAEAFRKRQAEEFNVYAKQFLEIMEDMEMVTSANEYYLLGRWVEQSKELVKHTDDFTKKIHEINAKALLTTWGSYKQAETGKLHDYSNRQWSGLIGEFYKKRWERWIMERTKELNGEAYEKDINWFDWEWKWVRKRTIYHSKPIERDLYRIGKKILQSE